VPTILGNTAGVGARLRAERERLRLSQAELAQLGGVSRNSQTAYETEKTPFTSEYLRAVTDAGVDPLFVIAGVRSAGALSEDQTSLLSAFDHMAPSDRSTFQRLACALAGQPMPTATFHLPSTAALEDAISSFLEGSPGLTGHELVHELAMSLPIILRGAAR
jgi:transcriptional regulator with XRE-family HTH domain